MDEQSIIVAKNLPGVQPENYGGDYHNNLLAQYLKCIDMADKISERRNTANIFCLSLNTGLISALGITNLFSNTMSDLILVVIAIAAVVFCICWYCLIQSYSNLNTAKFKVIHELERFLPTRPYFAEWECVDRGKTGKLYIPLTHIERYVPFAFILLYVALMITALV